MAAAVDADAQAGHRWRANRHEYKPRHRRFPSAKPNHARTRVSTASGGSPRSLSSSMSGFSTPQSGSKRWAGSLPATPPLFVSTSPQLPTLGIPAARFHSSQVPVSPITSGRRSANRPRTNRSRSSLSSRTPLSPASVSPTHRERVWTAASPLAGYDLDPRQRTSTAGSWRAHGRLQTRASSTRQLSPSHHSRRRGNDGFGNDAAAVTALSLHPGGGNRPGSSASTRPSSRSRAGRSNNATDHGAPRQTRSLADLGAMKLLTDAYKVIAAESSTDGKPAFPLQRAATESVLAPTPRLPAAGGDHGYDSDTSSCASDEPPFWVPSKRGEQKGDRQAAARAAALEAARKAVEGSDSDEDAEEEEEEEEEGGDEDQGEEEGDGGSEEEEGEEEEEEEEEEEADVPPLAWNDPALRRKVVKPKRRGPYTRYHGFHKKQQEIAAQPGGGFFSVCNDGAPYQSAYDRRVAEEKAAKARWVANTNFQSSVHRHSNALKPRKAGGVAAHGPYLPPVHHKFRDEDKDRWVADSTFLLHHK